jgi:hypothetical protein
MLYASKLYVAVSYLLILYRSLNGLICWGPERVVARTLGSVPRPVPRGTVQCLTGPEPTRSTVRVAQRIPWLSLTM